MTRLYFYKVDLELVASGAVLEPDLLSESGEPDAVPTSDKPGEYVVPGASLAGSLRALAERMNPGQAKSLFGAVDENGATASRIWVVGSTVSLPSAEADAELVVERATAIDRRRNAAASQMLRLRKFLPRGTQITVYLLAEEVDDAEATSIEQIVSSWQPVIGASVSTGHGRTRVLASRRGSLDLTSPRDLATYLTHSGPSLFDVVATEDLPTVSASGEEAIEISFRVEGSLAVGSGTSIEEDGKQVARVRRNGQDVVVPGTTWKGLVRQRVEYALRSLAPEADTSSCLEADCGTCLTCRLFGSAGSRRSRVAFTDAPLTGSILRRQHVAIDRFTGGAAAGLLYTREVVEGGTVTLTASRLGGSDEEWRLARALVTLAAQDIGSGFVGVGGSTTRGYGRLSLTEPLPDDQLAAARLAVRDWLETTKSESA